MSLDSVRRQERRSLSDARTTLSRSLVSSYILSRLPTSYTDARLGASYPSCERGLDPSHRVQRPQGLVVYLSECRNLMERNSYYSPLPQASSNSQALYIAERTHSLD